MSKLFVLDSESMQALPVFRDVANGLELDFKLKIESSGQGLSVYQVATGSVSSKPDLSKSGSEQLNLKIQGQQENSAEYKISTTDGALVIIPANQEGADLLTNNPKLVIGASIVEVKASKAETFDKIVSVVIPCKNK